MSQQYELIGFTDIKSHILMAFLFFCHVSNPLHISKTCLSCHCYSEARHVECWSHISTHPWSPLSCADRSLQCVWCTFLSTALSALVIDSCSLRWAIHYTASSQAPHPIIGCSSLTGWGGWPGVGAGVDWWRVVLLVVDMEPRVNWIYMGTPAYISGILL